MYISYCQLHSVVNRALIFHIIALVLILSLSPSVEGLPLPWCTDPTIRAQPCANNDTYCGNWFGRQYTPNNCKYREITNEQARMCVGERTIACLGDSIIRDMCVGLAMYLAGEKVEEGSEEQYHKILDNHQTRYMNSTKIGWVRSWKANRPGHNAFVFPKVNEATGPSPFKWQVQVWEQQRNPLVVAHAEDILSGKVRKEHPVLRSVDFAFWGHGLHEQPLWNTSPHGDLFYENIVSHWIDIRKRVQVPLVWTSINPHCLLQMPRFNLNSVLFPLQAHMSHEANYVTRKKLRYAGLPYYDSAMSMRSPEVCNLTADGFHVKMWVDLVRAQMLLNHLCDENHNWVGSEQRFV